jgi:hypothetical protein
MYQTGNPAHGAPFNREAERHAGVNGQKHTGKRDHTQSS